MTIDAIYQKHVQAAAKLDPTWLDLSVFRYALALALQELEQAVASAQRANAGETPGQRFYRMEHARLSEWLASFGLEDIDRSAVETAIELMASQRAEISELMESQSVELAGLRKQLATLDADNAGLTQELTKLRELAAYPPPAPLPNYTNGAGLLASNSYDSVTVNSPAVAAAEVMASITSQADETELGGPDYWRQKLSLSLNDAPDVSEWLDGIYAGRYKFRQLPREVRWELIASVIRILHLTENSLPRMFDFDEHAPAWMPRSVSIVSTFGNGRWQSILDKAASS